MSKPNHTPGEAPTPSGSGRFWSPPKTALGWGAIAMAVVAVASFICFPLITMTYREAYPIVDSWVMPAVETALFDAAASGKD